MRLVTSAAVVVGLVVVGRAIGCGSAAPQQPSVGPGADGGVSGGADGGVSSGSDAGTSSSVTLQVVLDPGHASSALVTSKGGAVTATGTDGTKYTLVVPAGALFGEETVTMTPLASATGLPLSGGLIGAVHLAPEGLQFQEIAVLTIEPAVALQGKKIHAFGYEGTGTDFHLQPVRTNGTALTVGIMHFSGEGLGEGTVSPYTGPTRSHEFVALVRLADLEDLGRVPTADELASVF